MSGLNQVTEVRKKRKRDSSAPHETTRSKKRVVGQGSEHEIDIESEILLLENQILESRKHYNSIVRLLQFLDKHDAQDQRDIAASVALCRIFCRLMAAGSLTKSREMTDNEVLIVKWLKEQLTNYEASMLVMLYSEDLGKQGTALTLLMRLMKEQAEHLNLQDDSIWRHGIFASVLRSLIGSHPADDRRAEFVEKNLSKYDDIRHYTFALIA